MKTEIIRIEELVYNGYGMGRLSNGKIIFVPFAVPEDVIEVNVTEEKSQYAFGQITDLKEESPHRVKPNCEVFTRCGGCQWLNVRYEKQIEEKVKIVEKAVKGALGKKAPIEDIVVSESKRYRRRARLFVEKKMIGFKEFRGNRIVPIGKCIMLTEKLEKIMLTLYSFTPVLKKAREIFFGESNKSDWVIVGIRAENKIREIHELYHAIKEAVNAEVGVRILYSKKYSTLGKAYLRDLILNEEIRYTYFSFFQSNIFLTEKLVEIVKNLIDEKANVLELFSGSGTFTLPVSSIAKHIDAVELDGSATKLLEETKKENIDVYNMEVDEFLNKNKKNYEIVLVDPPRVGLSSNTIEKILTINPRKIVYVSCNPSTLVRDIKKLGYNLDKMWIIDLFPNTYHIETVSLLTK